MYQLPTCCLHLCQVLQTKETLTLRSTAFGSKPVIPETLLKKVEGLVKEQILEFANLKQNKELAKTDGSKRSRIRGDVLQIDKRHECPWLCNAADAHASSAHACLCK